MEQKTVLIWDWDNTLVDTYEVIYRSLNDLSAHYGKPAVTPEETLSIIGNSGRKYLFQRFGLDMEEASAFYWNCYLKNARYVKPIKGAEALLQWTQKQGFINTVDSNKRGDVLKKECYDLGWDSYFTAMVGSEDTPYEKPSKEMAMSILKKLTYDRLVVIGDGLSDMQLAQNLEAVSVFVRDMPPDLTEFKSVRIDFDCKNLNQVKEVLSQLR